MTARHLDLPTVTPPVSGEGSRLLGSWTGFPQVAMDDNGNAIVVWYE